MKEPYTIKGNFKIRLAELGIKVTQKDGKDYADLRSFDSPTRKNTTSLP